jgi:hypothetical protein
MDQNGVRARHRDCMCGLTQHKCRFPVMQCGLSTKHRHNIFLLSHPSFSSSAFCSSLPRPCDPNCEIARGCDVQVVRGEEWTANLKLYRQVDQLMWIAFLTGADVDNECVSTVLLQGEHQVRHALGGARRQVRKCRKPGTPNIRVCRVGRRGEP